MDPRNDVRVTKAMTIEDITTYYNYNMRGKWILAMMGAAMMMAAGCGGSESAKADGPEAVVAEFNMAMASGNWEDASELCDTVSMKGYISAYQEAWNYLHQQDSSVMMIASQMLSAASIEVIKVEKVEGGRDIFYTIETEGLHKERKATVSKNEEGAWKIKAITDAI